MTVVLAMDVLARAEIEATASALPAGASGGYSGNANVKTIGFVLSRREALQPFFGILGLLLLQEQACAGAQKEETLVDSVRTALSSAIASPEPPEPVFENSEDRIYYVRWKVEMNARLVRRKSDLRTLQERDDFLQTVWYNSKRALLDVDLVLGLIQVESNFRKRAISFAGARGFMQVMPFWTRVLADGDANRLFDLHTNLRFGCVILKHYLDREKGDLFLALGRYNGSRGKPQYPDAVFASQRNWKFVDRPAGT